jgi:hypothetical protein
VADLGGLFCDFIERKIAGTSYESICGCSLEKLIYFRVWQVVWEKDWREAIE